MILDLFIVLVLLGFALLFLGHFTADKVYALVGLTFLFLLGVVLLSQSLQVQTGVLVTPNGSSMILTNQYAVFADGTSHWFGWLMSVLSFAGVIIILFGLFGEWKLRRAV